MLPQTAQWANPRAKPRCGRKACHGRVKRGNRERHHHRRSRCVVKITKPILDACVNAANKSGTQQNTTFASCSGTVDWKSGFMIHRMVGSLFTPTSRIRSQAAATHLSVTISFDVTSPPALAHEEVPICPLQTLPADEERCTYGDTLHSEA